ncbi:hypothetical protein SKAU_G00144060 [Synaphobranchus kaupii]|uniref:Uncharacterized protein n=1 Tax=Synaphobranchus kaupii TaxID=118154 RepID=A0A9Q1FST9_SYNKA|nr:hypothetical protein SKAU_G00144060 [Synaphobranchus kaupii]
MSALSMQRSGRPAGVAPAPPLRRGARAARESAVGDVSAGGGAWSRLAVARLFILALRRGRQLADLGS